MANEVVNISEKSKQIVEKGEKDNLWPQKLSQQDRKQLAYISAQYGLDPFFSDLTVLGGNAYVTSSGLKRNAHESEDPPTSIQLEAESLDYDKRHFEYKAKLWKKSSPDSRPYIEYGEASPQDCNSMISKSDKDLKAMARTRATNRVIRLAYNISITSAEELSGYDPDTQEIKEVSGVEKTKNSKKKEEKPEDIELWFGKHEGKKLKDVDGGYLKWLSTNAKQTDLKNAAKEVLEKKRANQELEKQKNRELTVREMEIKKIIDGDKDRKNKMLNMLNSFGVKNINDLDEDEYLILRGEVRPNSKEELIKDFEEYEMTNGEEYEEVNDEENQEG